MQEQVGAAEAAKVSPRVNLHRVVVKVRGCSRTFAWRFGIIPTLSRLAAAEPVSGKNKPLVARRGIEALDVKI
jgi:hypothetical protein